MCQRQGGGQDPEEAPPVSREEVGRLSGSSGPLLPSRAQGAPLPSPTLPGRQPRPRPSLLSSSEELLQPLGPTMDLSVCYVNNSVLAQG